MKTRLIIFRFLQNKKIWTSAISDKIHALMGQEKVRGGYGDHGNSNTIVQYNSRNNKIPVNPISRTEFVECVNGDDYLDLRHSFFNLEDEDDEYELGDETESVIDFVRNSREDASEFKLEDEIDLVADVFIRRFHRQMRMQKQESFKRYQEMLDRGV